MLVRIANRDDSGSCLGLCCLSRPFWQATSVQNFSTFTVLIENKVVLRISQITQTRYSVILFGHF